MDPNEPNEPTYHIDPRFIVDLRGKAYPTFPGILDAATNAGLVSLRTTLVQIPTPENGNMAVVLVKAEFADGRVFESVGDASPANCSAQIATAALRMAETRGAGRAMRAAVNCGMTLLEELPEEEARGQGSRPAPAPQRPAPNTQRATPTVPPPPPPEGKPAKHAQQCEWPDCAKFLTGDQCAASKARFDKYLCPAHLDELTRVRAKKAAAAAGEAASPAE